MILARVVTTHLFKKISKSKTCSNVGFIFLGRATAVVLWLRYARSSFLGLPVGLPVAVTSIFQEVITLSIGVLVCPKIMGLV
jgi:hypothetical protein